jgi:predicted aspartyl protease
MKRVASALAAASVLLFFLLYAQSPAGDKQKPPKPVRFEITKDLIILDVKINGKGPFTFFLDTGAGATLLTPKVAKSLGLKLERRGDAAFALGEKSELSLGRVASISIGDTSIKDFEIAVLDIDNISKGVGRQLDGIIGYTFLKGFRITIDYPKQTVLFEPGGK